jgi:hypothetical protein
MGILSVCRVQTYYQSMRKKIKVKPSPLSKYHPSRYAQVRTSFIDEATKILVADCGLKTNFVFGLGDLETENSFDCFTSGRERHIQSSLSSEVYPNYLRKIYQLGKKFYLLGETTQYHHVQYFLSTLHDDDYITYIQYLSLTCNGNNIFDFDSELLGLFEETDINNVLLKDICLPFPTIYLHFGRQQDKTVDGNINSLIESLLAEKSPTIKSDVSFLLDGAYVSHCPNTGSLRITLTSVKNQVSQYSNNCIDNYEDTMHFILNLISENTTVREAAELERQRLFQVNQSQIKKADEVIYSQSNRDILLIKHQGELSNKIDTIIDYLKLVINCLLYLQSYPEEIEEDYPSLISNNSITKGTGFGKTTAVIQNIDQFKYTKIKFCGRNKQRFGQLEDQAVHESVLAVGDKRSVSPHKRRAHLRKQRYGTGLQSWRYVWIKEMTVHNEKYQPSSNCYRIYEVETPFKH